MSQQRSNTYLHRGTDYRAKVTDDGGAVQVFAQFRAYDETSVTLEHSTYIELWYKGTDKGALAWVADATGLPVNHPLVVWCDFTLFSMSHPKRRA